jgi:hypothetical protein
VSKVQDIEAALQKLPTTEKWEVARWLEAELEHAANGTANDQNGGQAPTLPDYAARRRRIFGEKVLPNMVLEGRSEERW